MAFDAAPEPRPLPQRNGTPAAALSAFAYELGSAEATEPQRRFTDELLRALAERGPADALAAFGEIAQRGGEPKIFLVLSGWARADATGLYRHLLQNPESMSALSAAEYDQLFRAALVGPDYRFTENHTDAFLTSLDQENIMVWAGNWNDPATAQAIAERVAKAKGTEFLRSYVALSANGTERGFIDWLEQLPVPEAERAGLVASALRTASSRNHLAFTMEAIRSTQFASLGADAALDAISAGTAAKDPDTALQFSAAIGSRELREKSLLTGALLEGTRAAPDPEKWLAKLDWPPGDDRYAAIYQVVVSRRLKSDPDSAALRSMIAKSPLLTESQKNALTPLQVPLP